NFKHPSLFAYNEVPGGYSVSKSQYALDEDFIGMLEIPGQYENCNVVAIAENAFQNYTAITGVTLPEGLTSIGENAFAGCTNIKTVINKATQPLTIDVCPENAFASETYTGNLTVPFGSLDAYSSSVPWKNFSGGIKQGFGERTLAAPLLSQESKEINKPLELTLTNNNEGGDIYYYIVSEDEAKDAVHTTYAYTNPITTPTKTCTVCAYISDGANCSETASQKYTFVRLNTETGLDKVLVANAGDYYQINADLYGHYHDGTYLYASTVNNNGSAKNTYNEDKKSESLSDKESDFIQEDWVAISGLTSDYVGKQIGVGKLATVVSNTDYPVISFAEEVSTTDNSIDINTFRVENFNIQAESDIVRNMWLVAPQPGEYCKVLGFVNMENIHKDEGYLVLKSAESETINEYNATIEPLTMNVYFDAATFNLGTVDGWYDYTGIVSKDGDALKFTALTSSNEPIYTGIEDVETGNTRIFAANGNINVAADDMTSIKVFSATGQLVSSLQASSATIAVAPGFYLVKVGNKTAKIVVK
ncbi:MAG: leucine-rich repeat protein, partial [Muribaculaceae bacterium]|nr:leucine-rich repeat protein [Muribaculaceae bacterium]